MDWLNYTLLFERDRHVKDIRLREKLAIERAMLTGVMFHAPEKAYEMRDNLIAMLDGEDTDNDEWITKPQAQSDLAALEKILQRRADERQRERDTGTAVGGSDAASGDPGTSDNEPRTRTLGFGF